MAMLPQLEVPRIVTRRVAALLSVAFAALLVGIVIGAALT
jgi:hypothetical protein